VAPGSVGERTALRGSRCPACAVVTYPAAVACPRCGAELTPHQLSTRGHLWTWTVQRYPPKSPPFVLPEGEYRPFVVGYVELEEGIRVEAVVEVPADQVRIGMPLELSTGDGVPRATAVDA
jgi:uncharacterized protein